MIEIKKVESRKDRKEFINFPLKKYKNNPKFRSAALCGRKEDFQ